MLFGASYYHEYQPYERLERDLDLMIAAGFTVIRVGESTWASYEPRDGEIGFEALSRVVDAAYDRGLEIIVGTPTYAIPPWLARAHPEVMAHVRTDTPVPFGGRQNIDFTHPAFRFHAERIIRALGREFGGRPGVIGFQVDNEIGVHHLHNPDVVARFRRHVAEQLGGVDGVNDKWGLTYWSHRLSEIEDLWTPDGNSNPGYELEWDRFQASLSTEFLSWQRDLLRQHIARDQFVTHDVVGGHCNRGADPRALMRAMDRSAINIYYPMQGALELPEPPPEEMPARPFWAADSGAWVPQWRADMAYGAGGEAGRRFMITEAQAGSIGDHSTNVVPFPGQLRLAAHLFASRGADLLAYWHWHSLHYGAETYWGSVLGHDLEPGRIYDEVAELGAELKKLAPSWRDSVPDADVAMLYSRDSYKALQFQPALLVPGTSTPDSSTYHRVFSRLYQAAHDVRLQVRVVQTDSDWTEHQVLVVPALYIADDILLEKIVEHARQGAHVVVTFRTGYADQWARARWTRQPGLLRGPAGVSYQEFSTISRPVPLQAATSTDLPELRLPAGAHAEGWADGLLLEGATALAHYSDRFLGESPAITTHPHGEGRITWVGTLPDRETAAEILRWAHEERGATAPADAWDVPASVRVTSSVRPDGRRLWFVANHSWEPVEFHAPEPVRDLTGPGDTGALRLSAWDSRVLLGGAR
ncbi:beta-galactosidase [Streptomyces mayteni]